MYFQNFFLSQLKDYYPDRQTDELITFFTYFLNVSPEVFLQFPIEKAFHLFETISKMEEKFGVIAKRVDEYRMTQSSNKITLTHDNVDQLADNIQNIAKTYEMAHKQRKI